MPDFKDNTENLYDQSFEKDACGTGFVATLSGKPSHEIVQHAIHAVVNLTHRGATGADANTGDGAGILTDLPKKLLTREIRRLGFKLESIDDLAVGMVFLPRQDWEAQQRCRDIMEEVSTRYGFRMLGWRPVPIDPSVLGESAASSCPLIEQLILERTVKIPKEFFEEALFLVRKVIRQMADAAKVKNFYVCSMSSKTIVYKGLLTAGQLETFYKDLADPEFESTHALFHQRYSTNTFPNWMLAQPFRMVAHNGEINTLKGNQHWIRAREKAMSSPIWSVHMDKVKPVLQEDGSDSCHFDNALETLVMSGRSIMHSMTMMIPEAWRNMNDMDSQWRDFYEYHECLMEPWDGPAAMTFSDGRIVGGTLDRNGLRPARYIITKDGLVIMGSEVGMIDIAEDRVLEKGRLGPGTMLAVDTQEGRILRNQEIKQALANRKPYGEWLRQQRIYLKDCHVRGQEVGEVIHKDELQTLQRAFGYKQEDLQQMLKPMAESGKEPISSMGDDTPLAVLSKNPRPLYTYFKQLFAQVTNPAIDHLREKLVTSLDILLGKRHNLLEETERHARVIHASQPLLWNEELAVLGAMSSPDFLAKRIPCLFDVDSGEAGLETAVHNICHEASQAVNDGHTLLILSDRGVSRSKAQVPMLLAVAAVHHHLIRKGKRMDASLIIESGEVREVHHIACLLGYGADAVNPYLALQSIQEMITSGEIKNLTYQQALENFEQAVSGGLLKIMSKMGISTLSSYRGAQVFEALGISRPVIHRCFTGTPSRLGGIGFEHIAKDVLAWHQDAFETEHQGHMLDYSGCFQYRKGGEPHAFNPTVVRALTLAAATGEWEDYVKYRDIVESRDPICLRDLFEFKPQKSIPIDEVESIEAICHRFTSAAISYGAISKETHETLAIALNRLGGKSNSGEGGEDKARYKPMPNGDSKISKIKQVASGRFGVTIEYLNQCIEIEIKISQGSKPGEGGQLPGQKVSADIARVRHSNPGVTLISPPPHHDIYSIEDLAQLIYDLKQANSEARVCVKLVAAAGVGTIAAGVAKAHADVIQISGHDGGTGASPLSSIKNAGGPWELGLAEAQQVLMMNGLRGRVKLRADGGFKTGRDVIIAAILGAEEYGFGTALLVATGCCVIRQCHLNTCPVGVATQEEKLRERYKGTPEAVIHFLTGVAQDVRQIMAKLGIRKMDDLIGKTDVIEVKVPEGHEKVKTLELNMLLAQTDATGDVARRCMVIDGNRLVDQPLHLQMMKDVSEIVKAQGDGEFFYDICSTDRSVGTKLSSFIARIYGDEGLKEGSLRLFFKGTAGQSFGAFAVKGLRLTLIGQANDYVGKGLSGAHIIVMPPKEGDYIAHENVIIGNTVLYGATSGLLHVAGCAGERFGIRNSGASAVVEGVGDHCCEYMTGGTIAVLGKTGRNFGAGMTGGVAYVYDEVGNFSERYNPELVRIDRIKDADDTDALRLLLERHADLAQSARAKEILGLGAKAFEHFWKVSPRDTQTVPSAKKAVEKPHSK